MKNIIIFGGSGFIGKHYRKYFANASDFNVVSYDLIPDSNTLKLDVRNAINIDQSFNDNDLIINLAAIHRMPGHQDNEYFETNIRGAENVCKFAEQSGIKNIIFTSSIAVYGASEAQKCETTLPTPNTPYGISKLVAEHIHMEWTIKDQSRKLLIIRPGVVFGNGENGNYTRLYQAIKSGKFFFPGRKDTIKACIYVKDLVKLSLNIFDSYKKGTEVYNFTYEPAPSIEEIVSAVCSVTSLRMPKLILNGKALQYTASILSYSGLGQIGIHPDRVKKLMTSTNISGKKIHNNDYFFSYTLKEAITDWYNDCDRKELQ